MHWKLRVIRHWLKNKNQVSFGQLMRVVLDIPYYVKSKWRIKEIQETENHYIVIFKKYSLPLYIPKDYDFDLLYLVMEEINNKNHWHYYEVNQTRVNKNDIVVDCGAAEGLFTLTIDDRCKKVYAIEPLPEFVDCLKNTFKGKDNIEIISAAVSNKKGTMYLEEKNISSKLTNKKTDTTVSVITLDDLFVHKNKRVDYIKADLEGQELNMLKGAVNTIKTYHPKLAITTYHDSKHPKLINDFIKSIDSRYNTSLKGIQAKRGCYIMLHAWYDDKNEEVI